LTSCNPLDTGITAQVITNQFGCDSTIITNTLLVESDSTIINLSSCNPADTGTIVNNLIGALGCDSIVITNTTLLPADSTIITLTSCNPLDTGITAQVITNQFGCDSIVVINTTLLLSDSTFVTLTSCNPLDTGITAQITSNQFGCDSVIITNTLLLESDTTFLFFESCSLSDTGTVVQSLSNQFGCDSLVVTTTSLLPSATVFLVDHSCDPTEVGISTDSLINAFGCDSIIITETILIPSDTILRFGESCNPLDTGVLIQSFANLEGCDSIIITETLYAPLDTVFSFTSSCNPLDTGVTSATLISPEGCEFIEVTEVILDATPEFLLISDTLCSGETIMVNGTIYDESEPVGQETIQSVITGCDSLVIDIVLSFSEPEPEIALVAPACSGKTGMLIINNVRNGIPPYSLSLNGELMADNIELPFNVEGEPGAYDYTITDQLGCSNSRVVAIPEGPELALIINSPINLDAGDSLIINPISNFVPQQVTWSPANQLSCTDCLTPILTATESEAYQLRAVLEDGCEAIALVQVIVDQQTGVYAPSGFSPNGDGGNDTFTIFGEPGKLIEISRLEVYNRWGNQVFLKTNFQPNAPQEGWDGTFRGDALDPAVFVFYAQLVLANGKVTTIQGDLTLLR
ncbi:MAG: gliding motility-associated C-terminal domain-containing protein, partial [Phaeodactylibacter sp.]|nr:gliding motility-associated C-terminal domain-containing protein [Phaeodactylibacter sp.]